MNPTTQRLQGTLAVAAVLAFLVGVPTILVKAGMTPWTTDWGTVWDRLSLPDNGTLLVTLLGLVAWAGWAYLTVGLIADLFGRVQGARVPRVRGFGLSQGVARRVIDVAALAFAAVPTLTAFGAPAQATAPAVVASLDPTPVPTTVPAPVPASVATSSAPAAAAATTASYTVRRGDSLWRIAEQQLGDPHRWTEIHELNRALLGDQPDLIAAGTVLQLPAPAAVAPAGDYIVEPGDTLSQIAKDELGDPNAYPQIVEASKSIIQPGGQHLTDPNLIYPGWTLDVTPDVATSATAAPATVVEPAATPTPPDTARKSPATAPTPPAETSPSVQEPRPDTPTAPLVSTEARRLYEASPDASQTASDDPEGRPSWLVPALIGPGTILAAGLFLTVRSRRRNGLRHRVPGQVPGPLPTEIADVAETVRITGQPNSASLRTVHLALTSLAAAYLDPCAYPPVHAVDVTDTHVRVHLLDPTDLPSPWVGSGTTWRAPLDADFPDLGIVPPYPMLVSVGQADDGALWLLNLEQITDTSVSGDIDAVQAFGRNVATELAVSPWSRTVQVDVIGFAPELDGFGPGRITHHADDAEVQDLAARVEGERSAEDWDPEILRAVIVDTHDCRASAARLSDAIRAHASRPGVVCLRLGETPSGTGLEVVSGRLRYAALDLDVTAVGLPAQEAAAVTALVHHAQLTPTTSAPARTGLTDTTGAIIGTLTLPRPATNEPAPGTLLPEPAERYADGAAVTVDDVAVLAPVIPDKVASDVLDADPNLDRDLAMWKRGKDCPWPTVTILGEVGLRGHGPDAEVASRRGHYAELATYLWLHPKGATSAKLAEAFGCSLARVRADMTHLRTHFGKRHVPKGPARNDPAYADWPGYHLVDVLVDRDLFDRLRARAQARGATDGADAGIHDLITALDLVHGQPLTDDRPGNAWHWYYTEVSYDRYDAAGIVDVALTVQAHALARPEPDTALARRVLEIALTASPYSEEAWQALANVADAEGNHAEADQLRSDNRRDRGDDEAPLDPPVRTRQIAARRRKATPGPRTRN
ncbi:LysM peptidoglycan-binding domain-containing protein [Xylanimonas protaetiae]|uniref:LysM peptidoglycan-binding domain-containing protein n=1 Tax=Xylanimonas protaetiae TaxID=2509457 RepID=A0A4P6F789_9MICO|nr:LysM peptidoglycan-binding domain-containing protein [Xylanimonas protaetiae]QAY71632.1 LysM peptidoglycan-binding domain-containing protein [Xylanimonas protaetiae]